MYMREIHPLSFAPFAAWVPKTLKKYTSKTLKIKQEEFIMKKFVCKVCGYVHEGDTPPEVCPLCGVGPEDFEEVNE